MRVMEQNDLIEQSRRFQQALKQSNIKNLSELVRRLDEDYSKIYTYWKGRSPMPVAVAKKIGRLLNVRAAWLVVLEDDPDTEFTNLEESEKKLLVKYRITDERGRYQIQSSANAQPSELVGYSKEIA